MGSRSGTAAGTDRTTGADRAARPKGNEDTGVFIEVKEEEVEREEVEEGEVKKEEVQEEVGDQVNLGLFQSGAIPLNSDFSTVTEGGGI